MHSGQALAIPVLTQEKYLTDQTFSIALNFNTNLYMFALSGIKKLFLENTNQTWGGFNNAFYLFALLLLG